MRSATSQTKFSAEPGGVENRKYSWELGARIGAGQLTGAFVIVSSCLIYASAARGWKGGLACGVAALLVYWVSSGFLGWYVRHLNEQADTIESLRRQLTAFVCDTQLGRVDKEDLRRLGDAAGNWPRDLTTDDFSLISRNWNFWLKQWGGDRAACWDEQDGTVCVHCHHPRREHATDGRCPSQSGGGTA
jgi:hypothetical protein